MMVRTGLIAAVWALGAGMASAQALPEPLAQALNAAAVEDARENWRFSMTVTTPDGEMQGRFDGSAAEDQRWVLVSPAEDELEGTLAEIWADVQEPGDPDDPGGLLFQIDDFDYVPGSIAPVSEDASGLRYAFAPQLEEGEEAMADFVTGEVTLRADMPQIQQIRVFATESFKPNVAVRVNEFELLQEFEPVAGFDAPVMTRMVQSVSGSAAFQSFEQNVEIRFDEIQHLER